MNADKLNRYFQSLIREHEGVTEPEELAMWTWDNGPLFQGERLPIEPDGAMPGAQAILTLSYLLKSGAISPLIR